MNKLSLIVSIFCLFSFVQCQTKTNQNESHKSVIVLNDTIKHDKSQDAKSEYYLIGKWFMPHMAYINITFNENKTFIFNYFNRKTEEMEILRGTFELKGNKLILKYNDRPQQIFNFAKGKSVDDNYYITKGKIYYFVKSDNEFLNEIF